MKRIALLLAGLALGTTSPAMADAWTTGGPVAATGTAKLQLAQNDDPRDQRDRRTAKDGKDNKDARPERGDPRGEARAPREAPPQRDQREPYGRRETRQAEDRNPREQPGRPEPREAPQAPRAYVAPRFSAQEAIGQIARQSPGGRLLDSNTVMRGDRTFYSVRWQTRDGQRVDFLVDAANGAISRNGG
jgi:uncharacterized membrane protein YkoI